MDAFEYDFEDEGAESPSPLRNAFVGELTPEKAEIITLEIYRQEALAEAAAAAKRSAGEDHARYQRRAEHLRAGLLGLLQANHLEKIKTPIGTPSVSKPKERIELDKDVNDHVLNWPADVRAAAVEENVTVDKNVLKKFGAKILATLPGVRVVKGEESLTIR